MTSQMNEVQVVHGTVDAAFAPCLEAFRANMADGELGAACAIYLDGKPVVDLWSGVADPDLRRRWERETAVPVFSVTKGVAALCILAQASKGAIDLCRPLADYWPEFAAHGKDRISVRETLAHRAGVPVISGDVTLSDLSDSQRMAARLAEEEPLFAPGTAHVYHAITIGWITSELMRRVAGKTVGEWLRRQLAMPLDLNIQIGRQIGDTSPIAKVQVPVDFDTPDIDPASIPARAISLNGLYEPRLSGLAAAMNDPAMQQVELAGANGVADARSLARLYSKVMGGGGEAALIAPAFLRMACEPVSWGTPWGQELPGPVWGAGLMLPWTVQPMLGPGSFGHDGAGGALAFGHAPSKASFAYVRNRVGPPGVRDRLVYRVVDAFAGCLGLSVPEY